jgi:hypothetical protein
VVTALLLAPLALADQPVPVAPDVPLDPDRLRWSGAVLPLFGANSQDGAGFGAGGEIFARPRSMEEGYRVKFTVLGWVTTSLNYTSDFVQVDLRGRTHWIARAGYQGWRNLGYVGAGGDRVLLDLGPDETGNRVRGPFAFVGASRPLAGTEHLSWFTQVYYKTVLVDPKADGLLDDFSPLGAAGGTYVDGTFGVQHDSTDAWPMPNRGVRAETSGRVGLTFAPDGTHPVVGANAELIAWEDLGDHLVVAGRIVGEKSVGDRPFFDQDIAGGRWRDELGSEQMFSGYGRTRTRGDGFMAAMVEVRPYFFKTTHPFLDFEFHASFFAEQGWLFDGWQPGAPLPTVGLGPQVLFQGAIQCRPFVAWGWRSDRPGGPREPVPQFGISFLDPL